MLHVISPTDSVRDRLAAAIHYKDLSSAKQAAEIAKLHEVDLEVIKSWCEEEGGATVFAIFDAFRNGVPAQMLRPCEPTKY